MAGSENSRISEWFQVGAATRDITPPLEVGLLMSSVERRWQPFSGVRRPLFARALVLDGTKSSGASQRVAIVSLDLLVLSGNALGGFDHFKRQICLAANQLVSPDEVILACTHTHSAPESGAMSDLYQTSEFQTWSRYLASQIGGAIADAVRSQRPCQLSTASANLSGVSIHRRYKTTNGIMLSHPEPTPEIVLSREGAVDHSVNVASFRDADGNIAAVVVNATCHPVHEMCIPLVSSDYPGELVELLENSYIGSVAIFLNGAAGNINPTSVSSGAATARQHAEKLAVAVNTAISKSKIVTCPTIEVVRETFPLSTRLPDGDDTGVRIYAQVVGVVIGNAAFVFLPGEPFAETGLAIRQSSSFSFNAIIGFAEQTVGYVPTDEAFADGGYETDFGAWSFVSPGSEPVVRDHAVGVLVRLNATVANRSA
jgi:neutral ceramidase